MIREQPWYRHDAFMAGLKAAGYRVFKSGPTWGPVAKDDVLVIWNRYGDVERIADGFEAQGGRVIVAENGYLNQGGGTPKFDVHEGVEAGHYYALALDGHNGSGTWPVGGPERWQALGIELKDWRTEGGHVLVCPNRAFGSKEMMPPWGWEQTTANVLRSLTKREVRIRPHPGNSRPKRTLPQDLENCWAVAIWASSAGVHALIEGVPVFQCAPHWICTSPASRNLAMIEDPAEDDYRRLAGMQRLAWAQWTVEEIASGMPFRHLLQCTPTPAATSTA